MKPRTKEDILMLLKHDPWLMDILRTARGLQLPDWWLCAGVIRSKIWDALHNYQEGSPIRDVDIIYFDSTCFDESVEKKWETQLHEAMPNVPWSVKNQARMHLLNGLSPYTSSLDAISKFPETATALGVKIDDYGQLILSAPHGTRDALNGIVRPTPLFQQDQNLLRIFHERVRKKNWVATWPNIIVEYK